MKLRYYKRNTVISVSWIIPHAKPCGTETILQVESMTFAENEWNEIWSVNGIDPRSEATWGYPARQRITRPPASGACPRPDRGAHSSPGWSRGIPRRGINFPLDIWWYIECYPISSPDYTKLLSKNKIWIFESLLGIMPGKSTFNETHWSWDPSFRNQVLWSLLDELCQARSAVVKRTKWSLSLPPEGGGIIRSKIFRSLRFGVVPFRVKIRTH
jgi:hypothetical protein